MPTSSQPKNYVEDQCYRFQQWVDCSATRINISTAMEKCWVDDDRAGELRIVEALGVIEYHHEISTLPAFSGDYPSRSHAALLESRSKTCLAR